MTRYNPRPHRTMSLIHPNTWRRNAWGAFTAHWLSLSILALSLTLTPWAWSLTNDRRQPITVDSDQAESNEGKGVTTYSGNVVMQQGSMRIDADKLIIHNDKSKVTRIIALGKPAKYQQKPSDEDGLVVAQANRLEYNIVQGTLHLINNASLRQEGTSLTGNRIDYDVKKSVVKAGGNASQNQRVKMVIPAKSLKIEEEEE